VAAAPGQPEGAQVLGTTGSLYFGTPRTSDRWAKQVGLPVEVTGKLLRTRKAYRVHSARGGIDLITNLITNFEKHGKHGLYGKVVVNERISLH